MSAELQDGRPAASYQFIDRSVTRPALTRLWFQRLFPLVPSWLTANFVTLLSTGALLTVLLLSRDPQRWSPTLRAIVFFVTLQIYVAGDHLDGMQAVASGTTSPLGDFLDHYCDLWAGCILIFGFWTLLGTAGRGLLFAMEALLILGFGVTYAEREGRRTLYFTRFGTLEAIVILSCFFVSWAIPGARVWWQSDMVGGIPWYALICATGSAMAIGAIVVVIRRIGAVPLPVSVFAGGLVALGVFVARRADVTPLQGWFVVAAYGATYVGWVMHGHLVPGRRSWPDPVGVVAALALVAWISLAEPTGEAVRSAVLWLGAYLAIRAALSLGRIIGSLRSHWVWINAARSAAHPTAT